MLETDRTQTANVVIKNSHPALWSISFKLSRQHLPSVILFLWLPQDLRKYQSSQISSS